MLETIAAAWEDEAGYWESEAEFLLSQTEHWKDEAEHWEQEGYPLRYDLARRVDCDYVAHLVAEHRIDLTDGREMVRAMAGDLARDAYGL